MKPSKQYDVIIVGGGTAGCAAAYNAGILGLKTLLIEKNIHLGGSITSGLVIPSMSSSKNQINTDFFNALVNELKEIGGQITYFNNPGWFNPELCKIALDRLIAKANVEVLFDTTATKIATIDNAELHSKHKRFDVVGLENPTYLPSQRHALNATQYKSIREITLQSNMLSVSIGAKYFVDATGNCEIGVLAKCNFLKNDTGLTRYENEFQPVSLRFEMGGINLKIFSKWLLDYDKDRNVTTSEVIDGQIHLSTACTNSDNWALTPLFEDAIKEGLLKEEDRAYFQVFTVPNKLDTLAFNCPRIYFENEINPLDNVSISKALIKGREGIIRLANFCKIYFPGFKKAYVSNIADALGVRVSRRIKGKYIYTVDDLKSGKKFDNPALIGNYPIDIHSNKNKSILEHVNQDYQLPIESLISADYENLFVAGRCLSADFQAQAALRIQPSCFSMGEAVAKHIADLNKKIIVI